LFLQDKNILARQFGRIQYDQTAELLNVVWVPSTYLGELVAPSSFKVFDFSFALDPDTSTITSVHPPAIHVVFEINPFAVQRWADGYYLLVDCTSPEVAPFLTNTTVDKPSNKRAANQLHENLTSALKKSRTSRTAVAGPFKCTVQADPPCPGKPEWCRLGKLTLPVRCTAHKEPDMKKFVGTAIKVVAAASKCSDVSHAKKKSSKEDESQVAVSSPPAKSQQKSIADVLGIRNEGSPSKKVVFKCNVKNCKQKAVFAHIEEDGDKPVLCEEHGKGMDGTYPPSGVF